MREDIKYQFFITTQEGELEIFPQNTSSLNIAWVKENNSAFFRKQLQGNIKIVADDFQYILRQEKSIYRCTPMPLRIEKNCDGFSEFFTARLLCDDGSWDLDHCEVEIKANTEDAYSCYDDGKDTEYNLLAGVVSEEEVNTVKGTIETVVYDDYDYPPTDWKGDGDPFAQGWEILAYTGTQDDFGSPKKIRQSVTWIRETIDSEFPLPAPWILLSSEVDMDNPLITHRHYARPPALFDKVTGSGTNPYVYSYKYGAQFQNGMKEFDVMTFLLFQVCPELTLKSDFFQWNPDNVSTVNYETGEQSKVLNLILFQKSDVKRPPSESDILAGFAPDDAATIANTTFDDHLQDLCNTFNLVWWIDDEDNFRIEHPSYFNRVLGLDLTEERNDSALRAGKAVYSYNTDGLPKKQIFTWMDDVSFGDFKGQDIVYQSTCSGISDKNNKTIAVKNITTDVEVCLDNPDEDSLVSDDGFCLMACDDENTLLYKTPIFVTSHILNNTLSWAALQYDYWRYNNYFQEFMLNGNLEETQKLIPNKKQTGVLAVICCGEEFDPEKLVKTVIGTGIVNSATLNLYTDILTLEILFEQNEGLTANAVPTAADGSVRTRKNTAIIIDVLGLANDPEGALVPASLAITVGPSNGTAEITVDHKILYTPNDGFVGPDTFSWTVEDDFSQVSNIAIERIEVYQPPVAADYTFKIARNKILNDDADNLLVDCIGPAPLSIVAESKATTHGNVTIDFAGGFVYTPNAGYVGADTFNYTLKDGDNDTDTGTVTINVFIPVPVFAKFVKGADVTNDIVSHCSDGPHITGTQINNDFHVFFYSDAGGTVPLDVTGYVTNAILDGYSILSGIRTDYIFTKEMKGVSIFLGNLETWYTDNGCDHLLHFHREQDITNLRTSADYTIIS